MSKSISELSDIELREAVAVEVMGYEPHPKIRQCYKRPNHPVECWDGLNSVGGVPHYESSIAAAFEVVEKMRGRMWFEIIIDATGFLVITTHGETRASLPRAICLAALQAVRAK